MRGQKKEHVKSKVEEQNEFDKVESLPNFIKQAPLGQIALVDPIGLNDKQTKSLVALGGVTNVAHSVLTQHKLRQIKKKKSSESLYH